MSSTDPVSCFICVLRRRRKIATHQTHVLKYSRSTYQTSGGVWLAALLCRVSFGPCDLRPDVPNIPFNAHSPVVRHHRTPHHRHCIVCGGGTRRATAVDLLRDAETTHGPRPPTRPSPPRVTFHRVVAPLRGPGRSPVLPFACCAGSLRSVGRCGRCSCWCRFRVRGAQRLVCWGLCWMWHDVPFACQRRPIVGVLGVVLVVAGVV